MESLIKFLLGSIFLPLSTSFDIKNVRLPGVGVSKLLLRYLIDSNNFFASAALRPVEGAVAAPLASVVSPERLKVSRPVKAV